jgi:hypothetical protein
LHCRCWIGLWAVVQHIRQRSGRRDEGSTSPQRSYAVTGRSRVKGESPPQCVHQGPPIRHGGLEGAGLDQMDDWEAIRWQPIRPLCNCHARSPLTTHHAPRTTHHAPRTTHHAPRTTHHAPRTTHQPPRTAHHTPRTTHRGSYPSRRQAPVA